MVLMIKASKSRKNIVKGSQFDDDIFPSVSFMLTLILFFCENAQIISLFAKRTSAVLLMVLMI